MACELLRYRPADEGYDAWFSHITELVIATGEALAPSHSLRPPPSRAGDMAHGEAPPPPVCGDNTEPRCDARTRDPQHVVPAPARDEANCQMVHQPPLDARAPLAPQCQRQDRAMLEASTPGR